MKKLSCNLIHAGFLEYLSWAFVEVHGFLIAVMYGAKMSIPDVKS
jgi:hypothetical protein